MKRRFKDVEHLLRLAGLFAIGLLVFGIARAELVPAGFGRLGHYRAGAIDDVRANTIRYAGQKACAECHVDIVDTRAQAGHRAISCETCHGALANHAADPAATVPVLPQATPLCLRCHTANAGKPARFPSVVPARTTPATRRA